MLKVVLGVLVGTVAASQTRVHYRVLDPFAPNGLWTEISSNPKSDVPDRQALKLTPEEEETEDGTMSMVERGAQMKRSKAAHPKRIEEEGKLTKELAVHFDTKDSAVPYLPDLAALKRIAGVSMDVASPLVRTAVEALKQAAREEQVTVPQTRSNPLQAKPQRHSSKRHRQRKSPQPESPQLNAAPPMPQLPSLAAATDAPLPPEYPSWASRFSSQGKSYQHPSVMDTTLLSMDSRTGTHRSAGPTVAEESEGKIYDEFAHSNMPERRFGARASWPSDISPPPDYFLPPEVLI